MPTDPQIVAQLKALLTKIRSYGDPRQASTEWRQAFNLLKKTDADSNHVANVIAMRGLEHLAKLIEDLASQSKPGEPSPNVPDDATCKSALKAFRKRLKLTRLDDESQLDMRNPLTKGQPSRVDAITPPNDFGQEVWTELARRGELRHTGNGFYSLVSE